MPHGHGHKTEVQSSPVGSWFSETQYLFLSRPVSSLFGGAELLGSSRALLPEVTRDGESVDAHGHGFGRDGGELLAVGAVFVNRLDHLECDDARADAREPVHLLRLGVHRVHGSELATGISEEDEEVVGHALLHVLKREKDQGKVQRVSVFDNRKTVTDCSCGFLFSRALPLQSCFSAVH